MKTFSFLPAGVIALVVASSPALALSSRTFVSGGGSDAGGCGVTTPCRTFAYALTQTALSGEIIVLSSAGYGAVTITQSVSIINTSNFAGVTVASGNGITINAGVNDSVTLRGLTVDGGGTGGNGIVFNSGGKLTIDHCDLMNFVGSSTTGNGIIIQPTTGNQNVAILDTTASNNQYVGINSTSSGTAVTGMVIDRVTANSNGFAGVFVHSSGATKVTISNSIASFNSNGFRMSSATVSLDAFNASSNLINGVYVDSGILALGRSVLMNNGNYGLQIDGGTVNSYKDNRIAGNGTAPVSATPPVATLY